jgi:hypothetical protein
MNTARCINRGCTNHPTRNAVKAWTNHFMLNLGASLSCVFYAIVPPQWTGHSVKDLESLSSANPFRQFWFGLRGK